MFVSVVMANKFPVDFILKKTNMVNTDLEMINVDKGNFF